MTCILALDTTTEACSVALMFHGDTVFRRFVLAYRSHTQLILPMVDSVLSEAGIKLKNVNVLAFSRGPGSFTGVRIGIAVAQGLALGANLPLIGISTLALLAEGAWKQTGICKVLTVIDARMGEVYWAPYQRQGDIWIEEKIEAVSKPDILASMCIGLSGCWATAGTGWQTYPALLKNNKKLALVNGNTLLPNAHNMLPLALHSYHNGGAQSVDCIEPVYLRQELTWKKHHQSK